MRIYSIIAVVAVLFFVSIAIPQQENSIDANLTGYIINDMDGKHIVLNIDIMPKTELSCLTVKIDWDGNAFLLEKSNTSCQNSEIKEFDGGIIFYFSDGTQKIELTLRPNDAIRSNVPISLDVFASTMVNTEKISHSPKILLLHKEISLSGEDDLGDIAFVPKEVALRRNSPNPFNSSTVLEYDIPKNCNVHLAIFDVTGREVCKLVDGSVNAGFYQTYWDGTNSRGNYVSSGIYFAKLEADHKTQIVKMQFLK